MRSGDFVTYAGKEYYRININGYNALYEVVGGRVAYENGYKLEHRFLYELYHGVKLKRTDYIHHKNHNRGDNSIDNLEMLSASEHALRHAIEDGKKPIDKSKLFCIDCGKPIVVGATRCPECSAARQRCPNTPTKEELAEHIATMTNVDIAKLYGVSDKLVYKWRKRYGLPSAREQGRNKRMANSTLVL